MNCNCNNNGNTASDTTIRVVGGNVLKLAIPLTVRHIEIVDGEIVSTDSDFIPSSEYPVVVELSKGNIKIPITATMQNGNVAYIEDNGTIPVGTYAITITCKDEQGRPYRFKQATAVSVVDSTIEAGIEQPIEFETTTWYLNAALFLALKGEDGIGIEDIITESSSEIGGFNYVTIVLTNGETKTFSIMNGSGRVDDVFNATSPHPLSNSVITAKFNQVDQSIANLFGQVEYDGTNKVIKFFNKERTIVLATLDARPFIKDGMVSNVYISNQTLVITFNTDSGREAIGVPLQSIFNPNNYYTRSQVDSLIGDIASSSALADKADLNSVNRRVPYAQSATVVLDFIEDVGEPGQEGYGVYFGSSNGHVKYINELEQYIDLGSAAGLIIYDKNTEAFYRYGNSSWEEISSGGSGGGGYSVTFSDGNVIFSGTNQPTFDSATGNVTL